MSSYRFCHLEPTAGSVRDPLNRSSTMLSSRTTKEERSPLHRPRSQEISHCCAFFEMTARCSGDFSSLPTVVSLPVRQAGLEMTTRLSILQRTIKERPSPEFYLDCHRTKNPCLPAGKATFWFFINTIPILILFQ